MWFLSKFENFWKSRKLPKKKNTGRNFPKLKILAYTNCQETYLAQLVYRSFLNFAKLREVFFFAKILNCVFTFGAFCLFHLPFVQKSIYLNYKDIFEKLIECRYWIFIFFLEFTALKGIFLQLNCKFAVFLEKSRKNCHWRVQLKIAAKTLKMIGEVWKLHTS